MEVQNVKVSLINIDNAENSRVGAGMANINELMQSLKDNGQLQPVGLISRGARYEYVWGARRILAARKLGWKEIAAVIKEDLKPEDQMVLNLHENLHKQDISAYEYGRYFLRLHEEFGLSYKQIEIRCSISHGKVARCINIFKGLPQQMAADMSNKGAKSDLNEYAARSVISALKAGSVDKEEIDVLYGLLKKQVIKAKDVSKIVRLMGTDPSLTVHKAIATLKGKIALNVALLVNKEALDELRHETKKNGRELVAHAVKKQYPELF